MKKLDMQTKDLTQSNIEKIKALFPNAVTESSDGKGGLKHSINFDILKQELSGDVIEDGEECYDFTWVGKNEAIFHANTPINKTLRPCIEESKEWENTENLYIEGDNLEALKLMQESYLNKVKMIYIDPPYNTGKDFVYRDKRHIDKDEYIEETEQVDEDENRLFQNTETNGRFHSDWCTMLYPRLKLARSLLTEDGVIFISIDDNEVENLRKICDEVFGEANFIATITWQKIHSTKNDAKYYSDTHEYLLCYAKQILHAEIRLLPRTDKMNSRFKNPDNDPRGPWSSGDLVANEVRTGGHYDVISPTGKVYNVPADKHWVYAKDNMTKLISEGRIWFGKDGNAFPRLKRYLSEVQQGRKANTIWLSNEVGHNQESKRQVKKLFNDKVFFDTPKPVRLLIRCCKLVLSEDDIVLDFFSGSATTAHATMQLNAEDGGNRKFIMVQLDEPTDVKSEAYKAGYTNICEIGKERIRRAGDKIKEEILNEQPRLGEEPRKLPDIGFRVLKVADTNMKDVYYSADEYQQTMLDEFASNIKEDSTDMDLLYQVLLDWGLPLSLKHEIEDFEGYTMHTVDDNALIACFDDSLSEDLIKEMAKRQPLRVIFRDSCFKDSPDKINVEEIFKLHAPNTSVRVI